MRDQTQFYPTPPALADRMALLAMQWAKENKCDYPKVLDPSAGTGDLLLAVERANQVYYQKEGRPPMQYRRHKFEYYAIEIDPDRHSTLCHNKVPTGGIGYNDKPEYVEKIPKLKVIGTDFMQFEDDRMYDVIIGNPPFADGMAHLLHAWDLLKVGRLIFLLNAANLQRDTNKSALIRQLCLDHAPEGFKTPEIISGAFLGDDVERETAVDVALVVLDKSAKGTAFDFSDLDRDFKDWSFGDGPENALMFRDVVGDMVSCYNAAKENFMLALRAWKKVEKSLGEFSGVKVVEHFKETPEKSYESFMEALRDKGWALVFEKSGIREVATSKVKQDFETARKETQDIAFTEANIQRIGHMLYLSRGEIMKQGILEVFDYLTKYHEENRCFPEGWKTNKAWKVTKKFIIPRLWYQWDNQKSISWETAEKLVDIDRAMGYLRGQKINSRVKGDEDSKFVTIASALNKAVADRNMDWVESTFFKLRWYKKGTVHCEFLDQTLYDDFNRAAMIGKKWLPDVKPKRN